MREGSPTSFLVAWQEKKITNEAKSDSIEELLVEWGETKSKYRHLGYFDSHNVESDRAARAIFQHGLRAIVELAELQDDQRLTKHERQAMGRAPSRPQYLGELATKLLNELCGANGVADGVASANSDETTEMEFLQQASMTRKGGKVTLLHLVPLRILAERHSDALSKVSEIVVAQASSELQIHELAQAIVESDLPQLEKSARLTEMAEGLGALGQKRTSLQYLVEVDESACVGLLLPLLGQLPTDVSGEYWTAEEACFVHVIVQCDSDRAWQMYLKVVKRSSVGLRMEMMNAMNYSYIGERNRERRIAFLAEFLHDKEVRDTSKGSREMYEGPCAAFTFPKIEVRNFVAMQIAALLPEEMERPGASWKAPQWSEYRKIIEAAIQK